METESPQLGPWLPLGANHYQASTCGFYNPVLELRESVHEKTLTNPEVIVHIWSPTLSEQLAHSAVDLRLKEISEFLHGSEMNKKPHTQKLHLSQPPNQHGSI